VLHGFLRITHIVKLDEFVVLLVGGLSNLLDLTILPKGRFQLLVGGGRVEIKDN
jgi:hypothetical protein